MLSPAAGPFLFDTSAESWLVRSHDAAVSGWWREYLSLHHVHVSAVTVIERTRGYALVWRGGSEKQRVEIEAARIAYLNGLGRVWPLDGAVGVVAGEIMALLPHPPSPPRRAHQLTESRQERLVRWRFDGMIAATALVTRMTMYITTQRTLNRSAERSKHRRNDFPDWDRLDSFGVIL